MGFESLAHVEPIGRDDTQLGPIAWLSMVAQATQLADSLAFDSSRSVVAWLEPFVVGWLDRPVLYLAQSQQMRSPAPPPQRVFEEALTKLQRLDEHAFASAAALVEQLADTNVEARVLWARLAAQLLDSQEAGVGLGRPTSNDGPFGLPLVVPADAEAHKAFTHARADLTLAARDSVLATWLPEITHPVVKWTELEPAAVGSRPLILVTSRRMNSARLDAARAVAAWANVTWSAFPRPRASDCAEELYLVRADGPAPKDPRYREDFCHFDAQTQATPHPTIAQRARDDTRSGRLSSPIVHLLALCRFGFYEVVLST